MDQAKPKHDLGFYHDLSRITLTGLAGITAEFDEFYRDFSAKLHPALDDMTRREIPEASDQLNAIVQATEVATSRIMDTLEAMQNQQDEIQTHLEKILTSGDLTPDHQALLKLALASMLFCQNGVMSIFEELSFQDLTGQRIKRIVGLVQSIEKKVKAILAALGPKVSGQPIAASSETESGPILKGPQDPGTGLDQSAIDDLLGNL